MAHSGHFFLALLPGDYKTHHLFAGYSTDLQTWTALCTNQVVNGAIDFIDPDAPSNQIRFYRAVPEANAP